jgi:hypothetical protein
MTQVFADDDRALGIERLGVPRQTRALGPAMTAGKGVRAVRCVGCARDTLPRQGDDAPLCYRCCEVLSGEAGVGFPLTPRWLRRRLLFS